MNARTAERVDGWSSRSFTGGYDGLGDLADQAFSGVVETDEGPWLCLLNGNVIGVFDGRIEDFEDASGTTYDAPDPAVPLLVAMQERENSLEEQYYTKDAPISEADRTLSSGSFVGYIELSENILSGDYYVCYYGGRSMPIAFVGNSDELVTGDEAFEKADDEVGIYNVYSVDMEVIEIPETADAGMESAGDGSEPTGDDPVAAETDGNGADDVGYGTDGSTTGYETGTRDEDRAGRTDRNGRAEAGAGTGAGDRQSGSEGGNRDSDRVDEGTGNTYANEYDEGPGTDRRDEVRRGNEPGSGVEGTRGDANRSGAERNGSDRPAGEPRRSGEDDDFARTEDAPSTEPPDRGDVSRTGEPRGSEPRRGSGTAPSTGSDDARPDDGNDRPADRGFGDGGKTEPGRSGSSGGEFDDGTGRSGSTVSEGIDEIAFETLREQVRDHERIIEVLKGQLSAAKREHDRFEEEHDRIDGETDRLQETVGKLESDLQDLYRRVDRMEDQLGAIERIEDRIDELAAETGEAAGTVAAEDPAKSPAETTPEADAGSDAPAAEEEESTTGGVDLSAREALRKTNLLVRYDSKGRATLETAHGGNADRDEVNDNLRLDTHTSFDEGAATVEGRPFETFLHDSIEYEFTEWLVRDLPYEIRDTGNANALGDLYDALPEIDRIEMDAELEVPVDDESGDVETLSFDVVVRDKGGRPLVVANFNDSREPATEGMVVDLEENARTLRAASDLRAALLVTKSYFAPDALETVEQATGGSLLSRDSKKSYVKLSRKRGYHLCLVESRDGDFHVNVPEL